MMELMKFFHQQIPVLIHKTWKWTNSFADYSPYYIPDDMKDRLTMGEDMVRVLEERNRLRKHLQNGRNL